MTAIKPCPYCFAGEIGFAPDTDECPVCEGSGVARPVVPRWVPDTREEARGER